MVRAVDANVILHGRGSLRDEELITVPGVFEEIKSSMGKFKLESMDLKPVEPPQEAMETVRNKSDEIKSPTSEVDNELVALTLGRNVKLVSDDRALQNLALHVGADFDGFLDERISEKREWKIVCENCGREIESAPCSCGSSSLRRKPR